MTMVGKYAGVSGAWTRSSFCEAGACLEASGPFVKSSYSSDTWNCVEARLDGVVLVRDSKLGEQSPVLSFEPDVWTEFVDGLKAGSVTP
jgi:hypothetical protein